MNNENATLSIMDKMKNCDQNVDIRWMQEIFDISITIDNFQSKRKTVKKIKIILIMILDGPVVVKTGILPGGGIWMRQWLARKIGEEKLSKYFRVLKGGDE